MNVVPIAVIVFICWRQYGMLLKLSVKPTSRQRGVVAEQDGAAAFFESIILTVFGGIGS